MNKLFAMFFIYWMITSIGSGFVLAFFLESGEKEPQYATEPDIF
jgi:hypothetical protein